MEFPTRRTTLIGPKQKKNSRLFRKLSLYFLPVASVFIEWTTRLYMTGFTFDIGWLYTLIFGLFAGTLHLFIVCLFPKQRRFLVASVLLGLTAVYESVLMIYHAIFQKFFTFEELAFAGDAVTDFFGVAVSETLLNFYMVLTVFLPFAVLLIFGKRRFVLPRCFSPLHRTTGLTAAALAVVFLLSAFLPSYPRNTLRYMRDDPAQTYQTFGATVASMDNLFQTIFGAPEKDIDNPYDDDPTPTPTVLPEETPEPKKEYGYNTLNIDFEALAAQEDNKTIRAMHEYFASVPASKQNEYTGFFKGKNLIFLSLEGFSDKVIDPQLMPTLYKMATEGFVFRNFYDSLWGGSTSTGEYSNMTGNFYDSAKCLEMSSTTRTYSAMGNLFRTQGYKAYAYHNHTYTYYSRAKSHPNFGYDYKGIGNGVVLASSHWPNSDLEMSQATAKEFIDQYKKDGVPFHAYYMTVSGHANYTFSGNSMSYKHRENKIISNLPVSDNIKAYYACQYEVELMLADLIKQLDAAGILDDTVFAMCCDHYPYGMEDPDLAKFYNLPESGIHDNFELYRNGFILWSSCMKEPVVVDTPCSSYDIIPTLANLFGIPFESKVITGTDILSDRENVVIINTLSTAGNWNWITSYGTYYVKKKEFVPSASCPLSGEALEKYVSHNVAVVNAMKKYSMDILENDYYRYVFDASFKPLAVKADASTPTPSAGPLPSPTP